MLFSVETFEPNEEDTIMRKQNDFLKKAGRNLLLFLLILLLGLIKLKAQQIVYNENFSYQSGTTSSPKWMIDTANASPERFWVHNGKFEGKNTSGICTWSSSFIDISAFPAVSATVSLFENSAADANDFIRVYYKIDGGTEILFSENGNLEGAFGNAIAAQNNIKGKDLQIVIRMSNDDRAERYFFDDVEVRILAGNFWTGTSSNEWNDTNNWAGNKIPTSADDVFISAGNLFFPAVSSEVFCNDLIIEKGAKLMLNHSSQLNIKGDLFVDGDFSASASIVTFSGDKKQTIQGADPLTFYNLHLENTSAEGVVCMSDINIENRLFFFSGILHSNATVAVKSDAEDAVVNFSDSSFVSGKLKRKIKNDESARYFFPIGHGSENYFPATIDVYDLKGTKFITASFQPIERYHQGRMNVYDGEISYDYLAQEGMWFLTPDTQPSSGWYDLRLSVKNMKGLHDNLFGIVKRDEGAAPESWTAAFGTSNPFGGEGRKVSDEFAVKNFCTSFSEFAIGGGGIAIPIEMMEFKATSQNGAVKLTWKTATETNNRSFTVEKSNGTDFMEVAEVDGKGNSTVENFYSLIDEKPFSGTSYYRLRQTDFDGSVSYSKVVAVENEPAENEMVLFPNPSAGTVKLQVMSATDKIEVVVYNQHGTVSLSKIYPAQESGNILEMDFSSELPPGLYYMQVSCGRGDINIQKIVIS